MKTTKEILERAVMAKPVIMTASTDTKDAALVCMADSLIENTDIILEANSKDVERAKGRISDVMIDRLRLDAPRVRAMADGIRDVAKLPDPVGRVLEKRELPNALIVERVSSAFGVIAVIYESRPNVTSDAAALTLKSGNACILRSGKEAFSSAFAITEALRKGIRKAGLPEDTVQLIEDTSRESSYELMNAVGQVDLLIPRGGAGLINACVNNAKVPCIQTGTGICHIYVDKYADISKALDIVENAKTSRPSVCNAAEVCIVHEDIADTFLPLLKERLVDKRVEDGKIPVELRGDEACRNIIECTPAGDADFDTEFLDYILAVKLVCGVDEAISHIAAHSTGHSEAIITECAENAEKFTSMVDSAAVYVNASTRFTDGGEFGLGCEIGISTQKLHARGPMGLCEMNTYKYIILGNGQIR